MKILRYQNYGNENISTKNLWHDCLINYIPNLQKKQSVGGSKDKVIRLFTIIKLAQPRVIVNQCT